MNRSGNGTLLSDLSGRISDHNSGAVLGLAITGSLVGTLTITGMSNPDGTAAAWVMGPGATGVQAIPGSQKFWRSLDYLLSSASDAGKAFIAFAPN